MKITKLEINQFKRFTKLTIADIPTTAKLIVLVGPNGCGKSSIFDAFKCWQLYYGFGRGVSDTFYYTKEKEPKASPYSNVNIYFENQEKVQSVNQKYIKAFYFRTAYRNEPEFTTNSLGSIGDIFKSDQKKR